MAEVHHDAEVRQADLIDGEERLGTGRQRHVAARFLELVLDGEHLVRGARHDLTDAVELVVPDLHVVDLERVVVAVLAGPELHVVRAELTGHVDGLLAEADGGGTNHRVRVGEAALAEGAGVDVGRDGDGAQTVVVQHSLHIGDRDTVAGEREVDIEAGEAAHSGGDGDRLQRAHRVAVAIAGVTIDELTEQPQARTVFVPPRRLTGHGVSSSRGS